MDPRSAGIMFGTSRKIEETPTTARPFAPAWLLVEEAIRAAPLPAHDPFLKPCSVRKQDCLGATNLIEPDLPLLHKKLRALENAVQSGRSKAYCLSKWSQFVRIRDSQRCVDCHQTEKLSAHHIFRKTIAAPAHFDPGNGITLCSDCHRDCHRFFNRRPDPSLPVDAEGGEKLALMERLYCILHQDSVARGLNLECFYSLSEQVIQTLKRMQGYSTNIQFPGSSLQQAFMILTTTEKALRDEILNANGFSAHTEPFLPGTMRIWLK